MCFFNFGLYGDFLLAEEFEGYRKFDDFQEELWEALYSSMNALLLNTLSEHTRLLKVTKQLVQPMKELKMLENKEEFPIAYRIYSAHDTNVAAWMMLLKQMSTFRYKYVPYAATITFEVYEGTTGLYVESLYNGHPTVFGDCLRQCPI